jgi:tRNA(Ile)-lysidine synthase
MAAQGRRLRVSSNFPELFSRVRETIARHGMLRAGDSVGIAVSGGADSVALALILQQLQSELGVTLFLVHFNHQLRGADSDADENFVREFAAQRELEFVSGRDDVAARARENGWNLEEAARKLRYEFFANIVREGRATRIAVAHTANDQAETVIAQIVRGTGPTGLAGIYPVADHVIRPLLAVRGETLREFLRAENQSWREDLTNADESRLRAHIRRRLLPLIETDFQLHIVEHLGRLANLAQEDETFWRLLVEDRFAALVERSGNSLRISTNSLMNPMLLSSRHRNNEARPTLSAANPFAALTTRLIRRIFGALKGSNAGLMSQHVIDVLELAAQSISGSRINLPSGIVVEKSFGELIFTRQQIGQHAKTSKSQEKSAANFAHSLALANSNACAVDIPEIGHRLRLKVIDWPAATRETSVLAIDWDSLRAPLVVRNWQPGDAFRPHGRLHEHKLKELLRVKRVPLRERAAWPVLTSAGSVVWSRGFPVAEAFAARANTRRGVLVVEEPI